MQTSTIAAVNWTAQTHQLGKTFAKRAAQYDQNHQFVVDNYEDLKAHRYFAGLVPKELGGEGLSFTEMCHIIRILGQYCGSTALAFSMHQHLVAATVWKYQHKGLGAALLQKVAQEQIILVSTGARDWLSSNGKMEKVEGGYLCTAKKSFASQCIIGDIAITSAPYDCPKNGKEVLHFPVSLSAKGAEILEDWQVLGMRGTGSHSLLFDQVFIPEASIALRRTAGEYHPVWSVVLTIALPLIMSAYTGIAERAMSISLNMAKKAVQQQGQIPYLVGQINNTLLGVQTQWKAMYQLTKDFDFQPNQQTTINMLSLKTNVSEGTKQVVKEAMDIAGGQSFYQKNELERLFRDVQAAAFHPLPKWKQYAFTGELLLM